MVFIGGFMKKLGIFLLSLVIFCSSVVLCVSFSIQEITSRVVTNVVLDQINVREITNIVQDIAPEVSDEQLTILEEKIIQSEELNDLSTSYLNEFANSIQQNKELNQEKLKEQLRTFFDNNIDTITKELNTTLTPEEEQKLRDTITSHSEELSQKVEQVITEKTVSLPKEQQTMLNLYASMNTFGMKLAIGIVIVLSIIFIVVISKSFYHWLRPVGIAGTLAGTIVLFLFPMFIQLIEEFLSTDLLGKNVAIPVQTLKLSGTILLITSIVMIALYYIIKLFQKKNITTRNSQQI